MRARQLLPAAAALVTTTAVAAGCSTSPSASHDPRGTGWPTQGRVLLRTIPDGAGGFAARQAEVYLPPRALSDPTAREPVLELLHGVPGGPSDWLQRGHLQSVADAFARDHGGAAPVVVMPDINGSRRADTECIRTSSGADVESYLAQVVPTWVAHHLPVTADHRRWVVAGLSEGGTCAAMLALRHPQVFTGFADLSGLAHLTIGSTEDRAGTTRALFGGSAVAYDEHDPLWLLQHTPVRTTVAWFACGSRNPLDLRDQSTLATAASARGVATRTTVVPGGHTWSVWSTSLRQMLPWFWARTGS